ASAASKARPGTNASRIRSDPTGGRRKPGMSPIRIPPTASKTGYGTVGALLDSRRSAVAAPPRRMRKKRKLCAVLNGMVELPPTSLPGTPRDERSEAEPQAEFYAPPAEFFDFERICKVATKVKALVKAKWEPGLWLQDVPEPKPGPGEVLLRVLRTGICGTDLHIESWNEWAQHTIKPPLVVGHEFVGEVVELGEGVASVFPGEIVGAEGHIVCGRCRNCMAGRRALCANTVGIGVQRDGAFAELIVMPAGNLWPHLTKIDLDVASIFDPFGNAVHTATQFRLVAEDVLITGAGPIGLMAAGSRCSACPITSSASTGRRSFSKCSPSKASTAGRSSRPGTRCRSSCRAALTSHPSSRTASHTSSTRRRSPSPTQACAARLFWTGAPDVRTNAISPDTTAAGDTRRRAGEAGARYRLAAGRDGSRDGQRR